jgi:hypothetical protein
MRVRLSLVVFAIFGLAVVVALVAQAETSTKKTVEMLFVQSARGAMLGDGKLTLVGVSPTTVFFSDRPGRIAGHLSTEQILSLWHEGRDSFLRSPPNATLSAFGEDGQVANVVVELGRPDLEGDHMIWDARVLEGRMPAKVEGASLFIDVIGMPLTPVSDAGAPRHGSRRAVIFK